MIKLSNLNSFSNLFTTFLLGPSPIIINFISVLSLRVLAASKIFSILCVRPKLPEYITINFSSKLYFCINLFSFLSIGRMNLVSAHQGITEIFSSVVEERSIFFIPMLGVRTFFDFANAFLFKSKNNL